MSAMAAAVRTALGGAGRRAVAAPGSAAPAWRATAVRGLAAKKGGAKIIDFSPDLTNLDPNKLYVWKGETKRGWNDRPRRTGLLAMKVGMIPGWDHYGSRYALTVLQVEGAYATQVKTVAKEGYNAVQIGAGPIKPKRATKQIKMHCEKVGVPVRHHFCEFKVAPEGLLEPGTELTCRHFVPGQYVDVQGRTIGKGFQGGMKRWGFKGQPASHGVSLSHRSIGSNGASQDPGRVLPGKKMPGRMGFKKKTIENLVVFRIDTTRNLIYIRGHVPGNKGEYVKVTDARTRPDYLFNGEPLELPWPTYIPKEGDVEGVIDAPLPRVNRLDPFNSLDPAEFRATQQQQ